MITVKLISTDSLIEDACAILYQVYIEEMQCKFNKDNPSLIRIEEQNGRKLLLDRFIDKSIWLGAFDKNKLIGCVRLTGLDENKLYEVESYPNSEVVQQHLPRESCFEMNDIAVLVEYKKEQVIEKLYLNAFEYCIKKKYSVFTLTSNAFVKYIFNRIYFPLMVKQVFAYKTKDLANFYLVDYKEDDFDYIIQNLKKIIANKFDILETLEIIAPILPIPIYWHDTIGTVLGLNEHCLVGIGSSRNKVIGKTPYSFHKKEFAKYILDHNEQIMLTGEVGSQEESFENLTNGTYTSVKSYKAPLYDKAGNIIGIIGSATDIAGYY